MQLDQPVGIAVGRDAPEAADHDGQAGLLEAFAGRGRGRGFARLALAAGEFPVAGVDGPFRALPDQETIAAADEADTDRDGLFRIGAHSRLNSSSFSSKAATSGLAALTFSRTSALTRSIARPGEPMTL